MGERSVSDSLFVGIRSNSLFVRDSVRKALGRLAVASASDINLVALKHSTKKNAQGIASSQSRGGYACGGVDGIEDAQLLQRKKVDTTRQKLSQIHFHVTLHNFDPVKDFRVAASVELPHVTQPWLSLCVLGDKHDCERAVLLEKEDPFLSHLSSEELDEMYKESTLSFRSRQQVDTLDAPNTSLRRRLHYKADRLAASQKLIPMIPRLLAPSMGRAGTFPSRISRDDNLAELSEGLRKQVKLQWKKESDVAACVGSWWGIRQQQDRTQGCSIIEEGSSKMAGKQFSSYRHLEDNCLHLLDFVIQLFAPKKEQALPLLSRLGAVRHKHGAM